MHVYQFQFKCRHSFSYRLNHSANMGALAATAVPGAIAANQAVKNKQKRTVWACEFCGVQPPTYDVSIFSIRNYL